MFTMPTTSLALIRSNWYTFALLAILIFVLGSPLIMAQIQSTNLYSSGSIYSAYGIGYPVELETGSAKSHGILGLTSVNQEVAGLSNPAFWAQTYYTQGASGVGLQNSQLKNTSNTGESTLFDKGYLQLLFPLKSSELGLSVGLYPVTRSNLKIINEEQFLTYGDTVGYNSELQQIGGLNKFEIGFGWKISDQISIGYAPSVAFFSMQTSEAFSFSSSLFSQQKQTLTISGAAFSQRLGVAGSFRNVFRTQDKISVGATVNVPFNMTLRQDYTTEKEIESGSKTVDLSNILTSKKGEMNLPLEYAAGIGYAPHARFNISVEGQYQQWSDYSNDLVGNDGAIMADRMRVGFGAQYHPYKKAQSGFFSSFKYSAGLSYDSGHLTVQNEQIRTLWLHTGLGLLSRSPSSIDLSLRYGFRGTTESNLIEEKIWAIGLSVNLAEIMFLRPKLQ
jgi:hypothetical protein